MKTFFKMWIGKEGSGTIAKGYPAWMIVAIVVCFCITLMYIFG